MSKISDDSLLFSQTPSLNSVVTDLNNHIQVEQYWTTNQPRSFDLQGYIQPNDKYLNYRNRQDLNQPTQQYTNNHQYQNQFDQIHNENNYPTISNDLDHFSNSVTPNLMVSQLPDELLPQQTLDPRYYPQSSKVPKITKPKQEQKKQQLDESDISNVSEDSNSSQLSEKQWKSLVNRAQKALNMKVNPKVSESSIQNLFERMVGKLEIINSHNNLPNCALPKAGKKGSVLKSVPADDNIDELKNLKSKWQDDTSEDVLPSGFVMPDTAEERKFDQKINQLKPSQIKNLMLTLNKQYQCESPEALLQIAKASKSATAQLSQLKTLFTLAAERLQTLSSQVPGNDDHQMRNGYSQLLDGFPKRCEQQYSSIEACLMELRELNRLRTRIQQLLNINKHPQTIYEVIKLNSEILEQLQLQLNQRDSISPAFLAAEEFSARCRENKIGINPVNQPLITFGDTILYSNGAERQSYSKQAVRQACQEHPKILIRLTDEEAYQAFQAIMFVLNHFNRLFNTYSIGKMITRLTEIQNFTEQSRTLITAIKKILGLQQTASANKILEAVQAVAVQAADDVGVFSPQEAGEIMQLLGVCDASDVIGALKAKCEARGDVDEDERDESDQEEDD